MAQARSTAPDSSFGDAFAQVSGRLPGSLDGFRQQSFDRFMELGLPSPKAELWKYTNLAKFIGSPMRLARTHDVRSDQVANHLAGGARARRLIFINGRLVPSLSHIGGLPSGVRVQPLDAALEGRSGSDLQELMAWQTDERSLTALNAAFSDHGAIIELDDGVTLEDPIQLLFLNKAEESATMSHPRLIVRLGAKSALKLIESHITLDDAKALTNIIAQVEIGDDAHLVHDRLQLLSGESSLISKALVTLGDRAKINLTTTALGGAVIRNESEVWVNGREVDAVLNGVYLPQGNEHVDHLIQIHHDAPESRSEQFYKGVMCDHGRAAFQGKIFVHKDAQQTNAYQTNNNILLSDDAEIDSKPELEIYADDVKCSHGATCGDLDEQALFYLRSRGLDAEAAQSVLTYAFLAEVLERYGDDALKRQAIAAVIARLPNGAALEGLQ